MKMAVVFGECGRKCLSGPGKRGNTALHRASVAVSLLLDFFVTPLRVEEGGGCALFTISLGMFEIFVQDYLAS